MHIQTIQHTYIHVRTDIPESYADYFINNLLLLPSETGEKISAACYFPLELMYRPEPLGPDVYVNIITPQVTRKIVHAML